MPSLDYFRTLVATMGEKVGARPADLPTYGFSEDGARPHVEVDVHGFHYVVVERGSELSRKTTRSPDELLYWIFSSVTFNLACKYELAHRRSGEDSRRQLFAHELQLLATLNPEWSARKNLEITTILERYPFNDDGSST